MKTTLLGDLHGEALIHQKVMNHNQHTMQIGDCGFDYTYMRHFDPERHKILGGNHDNYPKLVKLPHYLGDYGTWRGLFYVRGARSVDRHMRKLNVDLWLEEEVPYMVAHRAIEDYAKLRPRIVVTHEAPGDETLDNILLEHSMFPDMGIMSSSTRTMLSYMLESHRPELWVFGHWHVSLEVSISGTKFKCLDIGEQLDMEYECEENTVAET
jgi:hypothetical protein